MNRQRVTAIIIQDHRLLLVRDDRVDFFSLPGGSVDEGEDHLTALARELTEEVGLTLVSALPYHSYDLTNDTYKVPQTDHAYTVEIEGEPVCSSEICELGWFSGDDIDSKRVKTPSAFYEKLVPKLRSEGLI